MTDLMKDLFDLIQTRKKYWLTPVILFLMLLGTLLVMTQGSVIAPFIYTLF